MALSSEGVEKGGPSSDARARRGSEGNAAAGTVVLKNAQTTRSRCPDSVVGTNIEGGKGCKLQTRTVRSLLAVVKNCPHGDQATLRISSLCEPYVRCKTNGANSRAAPGVRHTWNCRSWVMAKYCPPGEKTRSRTLWVRLSRILQRMIRRNK